MEGTHFVGRERELGRLTDFDAPQPRESVLLIGAPPGFGKSRLIDEHSRRTPGTIFATGSCLPYGTGALVPFREALRDLVEQRPGASSAQLRAAAVAERSMEPPAGSGSESSGDILPIFESFASAFRGFAETQPFVLVIEDIHWADSATLDLLHYLVRRSGESISIVATYRSESLERGHPLRRLIATLSPYPNVGRIDLLPLRDADVDLLLLQLLGGTRVGKQQRIELRIRAEGNPLFAEELARHALEHSGEPQAPGLPLSIEEAVLGRLPALAEADRSALAYAAVIGRTFDVHLLAAVCERPAAAVLESLRHARDLGLVVEDLSPRFSFRHALTREAMYGDLLDAERRLRHTQVLAILRDDAYRDTPVAELAYHAWAAGDAAGADYGERAGDDAVASRASAEAIVSYERAIAAASSPDTCARLHQKLGLALLTAGFPERASTTLARALALCRESGDRTGEATAALGIADALAFTGEDDRALHFVETATTALAGDRQSPMHLQALLYAARLALADHDLHAAFARLSEVEEFLEVLDERSAVLFYETRANARLMSRAYDEAIADQRRAIEIAAAGCDRRREAEQRFVFGEVLKLSGRLRDGAASFRDAWVVADEIADIGQAALYRAAYAEALLMLGDTDDAKVIILDLLEVAVQTENPAFVVILGRIGLFVSMRTSDNVLQARIVERLELDERFRLGTPQRLFPVSGAYAQFLMEAGRVDEATGVLRRAVARLSRRRLRSTDWSFCTLMTVAVVGSNEDLAAARAVLTQSYCAFASTILLFFDAVTAARANREDEAKALARSAALGLRAVGLMYEEALAWELAGELQTATDLFVRQGATKDVRRLQRATVPTNRRGRAENELTAREREIARAIAVGDTNRRIAERFCITEKTVETHVASIFNRLGVRSRTEVAAHVVDLVRAGD